MKIIPIEEAVGHKLSHELTGIVPGKNENITYLRGYTVKAEDVEVLKNMGKYHVKVIEENSSLIHENDAAVMMGEKAFGQGVLMCSPKEGKVHAFAEDKGVVVTSRKILKSINLISGMKLAARKKYTIVEKGEKVATFSITPLEIEKELLDKGINLLDKPVISVLPLHSLRIGVVTTGSEVYEGRIEDAFLPYLKGKFDVYGYEVLEQSIVPDDQALIKGAIDDFLERDFDLIVLTGGLSVDADDFTLKTVLDHEKVEMITYGSPVFPGAMFMAAYYDERTPLIGLPAGLLRGGMSILDLVMPLLLAKIRITRNFIAGLGDGGLL